MTQLTRPGTLYLVMQDGIYKHKNLLFAANQMNGEASTILDDPCLQGKL